MNVRSLKQMAAIVGLSLLVSCGNGGGSLISPNNNNNNNSLPPYIDASLVSFPSGSNPGYIPTASVIIQDSSTSADITTAIVTINDTSLTYNPASGHKAYEGNVSIAPGDNVVLSVTVQEKTYTASITQFSSYPTISFPVAGSWYASIPNTVKWSGGTPTTDAVYNFAVLDAHDPYGNLVWPTGTNNYFMVLPTSTTSYSIPANNVSAGDRLLLAGIVKGVSISDAAYGSELLVAGCSTIPITVVDATLTSTTITPRDSSVPAGITQQFTAMGTFSDNSTLDLTSSVSWQSSNQSMARNDYDIPGLVHAQYVGSSTITASLMGISDSTSLSITPAILQSIKVSPNEPAITKTGTQQFRAYGVYSDGSMQNFSSSVDWTSSNMNIANISNEAASKGLATAIASGATTIYATLNNMSGSTALTVTDWTVQAGIGNAYSKHITWDGRQFLIPGNDGTILSSIDGAIWQSRSLGTADPLSDIVWTGSQYVAVGGYHTVCCYSRIYTSPDGIIWTLQSSNTYALRSVAWSGTQFVAVGEEGTIVTSPDGIIWTSRVSGTNEELFDVNWSGSKFIVAGRIHMLSSDDGVTWTIHNFGDGLMFSVSVASSGSQIVGVGYGIVSSPDGLTWTTRAGNDLNFVIWTGTRFVAVGYDGLIMTSMDGISWSPLVTGIDSTLPLYGIAWSGSRFVVVGYGGAIITSP